MADSDLSSFPPIHIQSILAGKAQCYAEDKPFITAIDKQVLSSAVTVTELGIKGDEQGDTRYHGGADKALHHYPYEHYPYWQQVCGDIAVLNKAGAFGENISTLGMTEQSVCLGDQFMLGNEVMVEVSQSRQPCWKLNVRFDQANMAELVQQTSKSGWYYRVLQAGEIQAGDRIKLLNRPYPEWKITKVNQVMFASKFDQELFSVFLQLPLPDSWRKTIEQRLTTGKIEDMTRRLYNQVDN